MGKSELTISGSRVISCKFSLGIPALQCNLAYCTSELVKEYQVFLLRGKWAALEATEITVSAAVDRQ